MKLHIKVTKKFWQLSALLTVHSRTAGMQAIQKIIIFCPRLGCYATFKNLQDGAVPEVPELQIQVVLLIF
jgi:hypothetical protein